MVTGNNKKNTISEFKTAEYSSLKSSLCTLYLHPTPAFLLYSITHNGVNHYLKKIQWEENRQEVIENEFDPNNAFDKVVCLSFPKHSSLIPNSFLTSIETENMAYLGLENTNNNILITSLGANKNLVFCTNHSWEELLNPVFPECKYLPSFSPFEKETGESKYFILVSTSENKTHILLKDSNKTLLSQVYTTESETDTLFFVLSTLQAHKIEDQSVCNLLLSCETNEEEIHKTLGTYFQNIGLGSHKCDSPFPLSLQDKIDFSIVLNAVKCAL